VLAAGQAVEADRKFHRDGHVLIAGGRYQVGTGSAGTTVTMRMDGHLMYAIADGALAGTWPCPIIAEPAAWLVGARPRPRPCPAAAVRRVDCRPPPWNAGKLVTVIIEDTCYRILHGEEELAIKPRRDTTPVTRLYVRGKGTQPDWVKDLARTNGQACPETTH
jgi:hypothetical protein